MGNDGLKQIMDKAVVISGDEAPPVSMGEAEAVGAFAHWLVYLGADGSVPFNHLARRFVESQGWEIRDPGFLRRLRPLPEGVSGVARDAQRSEPDQLYDPDASFEDTIEPEPDGEPVEVTPQNTSPARAVIISGGDEPSDPGDPFTDSFRP